MLIRKIRPASQPGLPARLESLLSVYEKNLRLEVFFIERKDIESLLDLLPAQGDLVHALTEILSNLKLPPLESEHLQKRLQAADSLRESNKQALNQAMQEVSAELEQMNGARQRIRQMRQLAKSMYQEPAATLRLQNWA
jgi:biopolymer transport protein ExbB/TolQ